MIILLWSVAIGMILSGLMGGLLFLLNSPMTRPWLSP